MSKEITPARRYLEWLKLMARQEEKVLSPTRPMGEEFNPPTAEEKKYFDAFWGRKVYETTST